MEEQLVLRVEVREAVSLHPQCPWHSHRPLEVLRYPHGDGGPDRHQDELYDLEKDPREFYNLAADPAYIEQVEQLRAELDRLMAEHENRSLETMPLDEGIKSELPAAAIR